MGNISVQLYGIFQESTYRKAIAVITMSSDYATGGDTLRISQLGLSYLWYFNQRSATSDFDVILESGAPSLGFMNISAFKLWDVDTGLVADPIGFDGGTKIVSTGGGNLAVGTHMHEVAAHTDLSGHRFFIEAYGV